MSRCAVRGVVLARIKRLALGLMGDVGPVGEGVSELRIHIGAGWCIYFIQRGTEVLCCLAVVPKKHKRWISSMPKAWRRSWAN